MCDCAYQCDTACDCPCHALGPVRLTDAEHDMSAFTTAPEGHMFTVETVERIVARRIEELQSRILVALEYAQADRPYDTRLDKIRRVLKTGVVG